MVNNDAISAMADRKLNQHVNVPDWDRKKTNALRYNNAMDYFIKR